ncbi:MAG: ATP-binding protein [Gemmataceae bacterium]
MRKDGSRFWANVIITALHDESGKPRGFSKVTRDITERTNAEEKARRLLQEEAARRAAEEYTETIRLQGDQLRESDRRKTTFLAILSHELRNPLAPIRNALHLLQQAGDRPEIRAQALGLMDRQVRHMVRLVDDLLDISRISSDRLQLRKDRLDIAEAIDLAVETSSPVIETAGHRLTVTRADGPVWVDGDGARLAQVFSNLLNNAARYTPRGGSIRIGLERHDDAAVVTVSDNGLGIPPDMLGRVFDMFSNVSTALERTQGGLGIGLSLVRRLVEMHGGSVEARSAGLGRGAEFVVRLPVTPAPQARPGSPPAPLRQPPPAQPMGRRILVVDDNHDAAQTLALLLKSVGAEVRMAYDGMEALAAAAAFQPEVVLLDIGLPKLNGYEVARQLRAQPWAGDTVIIATTGWGQEDDRRKALEAGFDSHLVKPVNFKVIEEIVVDPRRVRPAVRA